MSYYVLIEGEVTDLDKYENYREAVTPLVHKFGGKYLVRGGDAKVFEGEYDGGSRFVVIEFQSQKAADDFWYSEEYAEVKKLRAGASRGRALGVEGV